MSSNDGEQVVPLQELAHSIVSAPPLAKFPRRQGAFSDSRVEIGTPSDAVMGKI